MSIPATRRSVSDSDAVPSTETSSSTAVTTRGGARSDDTSTASASRYFKLNPELYPKNCFHMPTIIDLPRKRTKAAEVMVERLKEIELPRERVRVAPERLVITEKGTEVKRVKLTDGTYATAQAEEAPSNSPVSGDGEKKPGARSKSQPCPKAIEVERPIVRQIGDSPPPSPSSVTSSSSSSLSASSRSVSPDLLPRKRQLSNVPAPPSQPSRDNAAIAAKRLALEKLDFERRQNGGFAGGNASRSTRLAAAASMAAEADFAHAGMEDVVDPMFRSIVGQRLSPTQYQQPGAATPSPAPQPSPPLLRALTNTSGLDGDIEMTEESNAGGIFGLDASITPDISMSPPPMLSSAPAVIESFTSMPRLNESALRRLQLSNTGKATYLSFEWVQKRCMKYLHHRTPEQQRQHDELVARSSNREFVSKLDQCGNLANGRLYVGVSRRSDHVQFWLDEQAKEIANRIGNRRAKTPDGIEKKPIPMLGLFAGVDLPEGTWVTQYGGVLQWGGHGEGSVKNRAKESNTHVRRIAGTDHVWDGRPWSLLFPRIPSFLEKEMAKDVEQRTKLTPTVTNRTLINLLLLLHHEDQTHTWTNSHVPFDGQKNSQLPFTLTEMQSPTVCQGTCILCKNEMNVLLNALGGRTKVGDLTQDDILAAFLPQCACCSVTVGLLPCEVHEIFSKWTIHDQEALWKLCERTQQDIMKGGLGYMANTDVKQKQNVKVFSRSPYISGVADMYPYVHVYQTTKFIPAGEEIYVAYNNNESKKM